MKGVVNKLMCVFFWFALSWWRLRVRGDVSATTGATATGECCAGNWTLYCKDPNGSTSTKYLDLRQNGTVITGHFKGPNHPCSGSRSDCELQAFNPRHALSLYISVS